MTNALPSGFYDLLLTERTRKALEANAANTSKVHALDIADSTRLAEVLQRQLAGVLSDLAQGGAIAAQLSLGNGLLTELRQRLKPESAEMLDLIADPPSVLITCLRSPEEQS